MPNITNTYLYDLLYYKANKNINYVFISLNSLESRITAQLFHLPQTNESVPVAYTFFKGASALKLSFFMQKIFINPPRNIAYTLIIE